MLFVVRKRVGRAYKYIEPESLLELRERRFEARLLGELESSFKDRYEKERDKDRRAELRQTHQGERQLIIDEFGVSMSERLKRRALRLGLYVEREPMNEEEEERSKYWRLGIFGPVLTSHGQRELRRAIRQERIERRNSRAFWFNILIGRVKFSV